VRMILPCWFDYVTEHFFCYKISTDKIVLPACENQLHTAIPRLLANMGCLFWDFIFSACFSVLCR